MVRERREKTSLKRLISDVMIHGTGLIRLKSTTKSERVLLIYNYIMPEVQRVENDPSFLLLFYMVSQEL